MATLFGETLRKSITEHNVVVTHLAHMAEIDRTTLQHFVSGRRTPSKEQMNKLLHAISIPAHKKKVLQESYELTTSGPDKFRQQEKIKTIIEKIAFASMVSPNVAAPPKSIPVQNIAESEELHGPLALNNALANIIGKEELTVSFFMPPDFSFFYDTLFAKYMTSSTLKATCFFPISNEVGNVMTDLEYCESFIPFFASPKHCFQIYYMRNQSALHDTSIVPFPYFILTSRHVLLLSADMTHAILTRQESFVRLYRRKCRDILDISTPLYTASQLDDLVMFVPQDNPAKDVFASIENQPCFQSYLNEQTVKKYAIINTEEDVALAQQYMRFIHELKKEPDLFHAFGREGLDYFVETGYIAVWPPSLSKPLDVPDRIRMLERMLHDIKNDKFHCRMVDSSKFTIPSPTVTIAVRRKTLFIQCLDYDNDNLKNICLTEKNIVNAFEDFLSNLPNTNLVHSKEETINAFESALKKLVHHIQNN